MNNQRSNLEQDSNKKRRSLPLIFLRIIFFTLLFFLILQWVKTSVGFRARWKGTQIRNEQLIFPFEDLKVLHQPISDPQPGDWLHEHMELGQSFKDYQSRKISSPDKEHTIIYIQPLGITTESSMKIIKIVAEYMEKFFCSKVKIRPPLPLTSLPGEAIRYRSDLGTNQYRTTEILSGLLKPRRPADALAYIAFTDEDLWPGRNWNFVFGQASLHERVGVWSLYRYGDPDRDEKEFRKVLLRTLKVATHETGHILGILHCLAYQCNLNGSNSLEELDAQVPYLCPNCLQKLIFNRRCDPAKRFNELASFFDYYGFPKWAEFMKKSEKIAGKQKD